MLNYEINGSKESGRPLVLLHGFLESRSMWDVLDFGSDRCLVKIDLTGHGESTDMPPFPISMHSMAAFISEILEDENISAFDVIGHSMGGYVALELAATNPGCGKVILMNSNVWEDSESKKADRKRVASLVHTRKEMFVREAIPNLFENAAAHQDFVEALIEEALEISPEAISASSIAMSRRTDYTEKAKNNEFDLYVIQGKNDRISDPEQMQAILEDQPDRFFLVDSGHMAHVEATSEVEQIVRKILK